MSVIPKGGIGIPPVTAMSAMQSAAPGVAGMSDGDGVDRAADGGILTPAEQLQKSAALFAPTEEAGSARFVTMQEMQERLAAEGEPFARQLVVLDTPLKLDPGVAHLAGAIRIADHHGPLASQPKNTVGQIADLFRSARRNAGMSPTESVAVNDPRVTQAIADLNIKYATTDNLADGVDALFMLQGQRVFLSNPALIDLYEKAASFIDFGAFTTAYASSNFEELPPEIVLALAHFRAHDKAIASPGLKFAGADRFAPENAKPIIDFEMPLLSSVLADVGEREALALEMWQEVQQGIEKARTQAVIDTIDVNGKTVGYFYTNSAMKGMGYFAAQLAFSRAHPDATFYVKVIEPPANIVRDASGEEIARNRIYVMCLPYGATFPIGQFIDGEFAAAARDEDQENVERLTQLASPETAGFVKPVSQWIMRNDVLITGGGTFMSLEQIKAMVEQKLGHLFVGKTA